ncbi:MAG: hypothetical protein IKU41_03795 [Clostridia bacterium]|nr:hypothetical protein [Clostridia bacterium]
MTNLSFRYKLKISNVEIFDFLTEINGVEPTQWFITKNGGKNKKDVLAYIFNNTPENIQLVAIKGKKRNCYIDKESVVTYSKTDDIESLTVAEVDFYEIKIKLKNGTKYVIGAFPIGADKSHKASMKALRTEYKQVSKKAQTIAIVTNVLIIGLIYTCLFNAPNVSEKIGNRYILAKYIQNTIESGEYKKELSVVLKPYDKQDLKLEGDYTTIEAGYFRLSLPGGYAKYVNPDYGGEESSMIVYDYKVEDSLKRIIIDKEFYDGTMFTDFDEKIGDTCEKKFGFRIDSDYNWNKLMWSMDYYNDDINYFDPEELVLYYSMLSSRVVMVGAVTEVYDVETSTYKGRISIMENELNNTLIVFLDAYAHDDLNTSYRISTIVPKTDSDEAYKILNSVELITE